MTDAPPDDELAAVWLAWWLEGPVARPTPAVDERAVALDDLSSLQAHLAAHGFAIVRRMADPE